LTANHIRALRVECLLLDEVVRLHAEVERLTRERDHYQSEGLVQLAKTQAAQDRAADAEKRLRANQLPDGGEWRTERGIVDGSAFWIATRPTAPATHQRRVWYGPAEPVAQ
jgi:hypothetical protein